MTHGTSAAAPDFPAWVALLETRHGAGLRLAELARAVRALSAAYVEGRRRRPAPCRVRALASAGKRAAFALYYGGLHFLTVRAIVRALGAADPALDTIVDLGCGTGVAGAAWSLESGGRPRLVGVDAHAWAVGEAAWTYRALGLRGRAVRADLAHFRLPPRPAAIVAAYVLNELDAPRRRRLFHRLLAAATAGTRLLVIEPIARGVVPEWDRWAASAEAAGGRADEWRFAVELPPTLARLDRAAGLDHRVLTARSIWVALRPHDGSG